MKDSNYGNAVNAAVFGQTKLKGEVVFNGLLLPFFLAFSNKKYTLIWSIYNPIATKAIFLCTVISPPAPS
jgi:hypothetical protein